MLKPLQERGWTEKDRSRTTGRSESSARGRLLSGLPVSETRLTLAGVPTAVLEGGAGEPMVLLHGAGESALKWLRVIPELVRHYRVIAPDLPAHGASAAPGAAWEPERVIEWLADLIEHRCPAPPILVGHVLGGAIAARFASSGEDRLRRLVLVDTLGLAPFRPTPRFALSMMHFLTRPGENSYNRLMRQCSYDLDRLRDEMGERWEPFVAYNLEQAGGARRRVAWRLLREIGLPPIPSPELERIAVPTALIWGRHDRANRVRIAEQASARYGWPLHVIEDCADDPARDEPGDFLRAVRAIATVAPPERSRANPGAR